MSSPPGLTVEDRLRRILQIDPDFDVLIVHRDTEKGSREERVAEIGRGRDACAVAWPTIPVVPIRMTEAWLLLDEDAIRTVAGRPSGREPLNLPTASQVEAIADPKARLQEVLALASGRNGRRLSQFKRDFPAHRRQLIDLLDRAGPVERLQAWQALRKATAAAMAELSRQGGTSA